MSSSIPSPFYLLLTNPSWGGTKAYHSVLEGLSADWTFDPNETHDGKSLLGLLLVRWCKQRLSEEGLLQVLEALIGRGADPDQAMQEASSGGMRWSEYSATQKLLSAAALGKDLSVSTASATLMTIVAKELNVQAGIEQVKAVLDTLQGWDTEIDGIKVLPWLALNCCEEGKMKGWPTNPDSTTSANVQKMRLLRNLALTSKAADTLDSTNRLLLGCGMSMMSSYYTSNAGETEAGQALDKVTWKVLGEDTPALIEGIRLIVATADLDPVIKVQTGMAVGHGLAQDITDPEQSWAAFAAAIPLMYQEGKFAGDDDTLSHVLTIHHGIPSAQFWDALPHDAVHHDAMMRVLLCSSRSGRPWVESITDLRQPLLDDMFNWARQSPLPPFDMAVCKSWVGNRLDRDDPTLFDRLDSYQDKVRSAYESETLQGSTASVPFSTGKRPRI